MARGRLWLWLPLGVGAALVTAVVIAVMAVVAFPDLVRRTVVAALEARTGRDVAIDVLDVDPWTGRIALRGLRVTDTDGGTLATLDRLDAQVRRRALLRGHVSLTHLALDGSAVRVVRHGDGEFNISDLMPKKPGGGGPAVDVTVDEFTLTRGTVLLEDRSLSPWRTWRSEDLTFHARNVSTRRDDGTAEARSTINGSPVTVRIDQLRLKPVHLRAVVHANDVDAALARVYLPADAPVTLERGRLDLTITAVHDARDGVRLDADATVTDAVAIRRFQRDPFVRAPALRVAVRDLTVSRRGMALGRVEVDGRASVLHGDVDPPARFDLDRVRVRAEALTWPVQAPARVSLASSVPGGGELRADGTVGLNPTVANLDVRLTGLSLEPWARYVSSSARATGTGEARLAVRASLDRGLTATATGMAAVSRLTVTDGDRRLLAAERAEVTGIDVGWPARLAIGRVQLRRPALALERDAAGVIALPTRDKKPAAAAGEAAAMPSRPTAAMPPVTVREVVVTDGAVDWRDAAVKPAARLDVRAVQLHARDVAWPPEAPTPLELRLRAPGGGSLSVNGTVTAAPPAADLRVRAQGVDLAPYRPYLPVGARVAVGGRADVDVQARLSRGTELQARLQGDATLRRAFVGDGPRRIASIERAEARGVDVEWPARALVDRVTLRQPWVLVERDEQGALTLRSLLAPTGDGAPENADAVERTLGVRSLVIEDGGARVVDRSLGAPYAEDFTRMWAKVTGLATGPAAPARVEARGVIGPAGRVSLSGRVGPLGAPLFLDATMELHDVAIPRLNPYLLHYTAWSARQGRLSTRIEARVEGDQLDVDTHTELGQLRVVRAAPDDAVERRVGLPLGMVVALLKDRRGNIALSLPVGGRLGDPKFEFDEALWSALRTLTVRTIALPVSWIGRLRVTPDSRIADIEVDPVPFAAGTDSLTQQAAERVGAVAGFMKTLPDVRMILTPAVSLGDVEALKAEQIRARIRELMRQHQLSEADAAGRLYAEHYRREPPPDLEAVLIALREVEPPPADEAYRLAKRRAEAVRDALRKAEIDPERLQVVTDAEALDTFEGGRLEFSLTDRVKPRRTLADLLRALVQALAQRLEALKR